MPKDLHTLPTDLPVPVDDGACAHLTGSAMPAVTLTSTAGEPVHPAQLPGTVVYYIYPMTGRPDSPPMIGWNDIPGARGCTPQSCAFRDHYQELQALGAQIFGISAQSTADQQEARERLHLPFHLLSDIGLQLATALHLPTFVYEGKTLIRRLTLIVENGMISKVFYPVFPPDANAGDVLHWLAAKKPAKQEGES
jgi:peroxiredoxin